MTTISNMSYLKMFSFCFSSFVFQFIYIFKRSKSDHYFCISLCEYTIILFQKRVEIFIQLIWIIKLQVWTSFVTLIVYSNVLFKQINNKF